MGTWGTDGFENDSACDFAAELVQGDDLAAVEAALDAVIEQGCSSIDAEAAEQAVAAAEVVARCLGRPGRRDAHTAALDAWIERHAFVPGRVLVKKALAVVDRVRIAPCELLEVWEEGGDAEEWKERVGDLRERLGG